MNRTIDKGTETLINFFDNLPLMTISYSRYGILTYENRKCRSQFIFDFDIDLYCGEFYLSLVKKYVKLHDFYQPMSEIKKVLQLSIQFFHHKIHHITNWSPLEFSDQLANSLCT